MVDLSSLEKYTDIDASLYIDLADKSISKYGFNIWFDKELKEFIDCSMCLPDGSRVIQTNFTHYKKEIVTILEMIKRYGEDSKDYYYNRLLSKHKDNLEFEAINGLPYDIKKTTKKKSTRKRTRQTSITELDKPKKETVAEKKLKAYMAKISSLKIKLKPASNGNGTI